MTFVPEPGRRIGPHSECGACSYPKNQHGRNGECPTDMDDDLDDMEDE